MRWQLEHLVDAPLARVERAALDPASLALIPEYMPMIASAEVLAREQVGDVITRRAHFRPSAGPPSFARGVSREMFEWDEHMRWDLASHVATWRIEPNLPPAWRHYFHGEGTYRLEPRGDGRTARIVEGVVEIRVAVVGALAERYAVKTLRAQFDGEARLLAARAAAVARAEP